MRFTVVVLAAVGAAAVAGESSARAQQPAPALDVFAPPIAPADMPYYCIYENRIYSLGAGLCLGRTGYTCVPQTGPATGNRAYWSGKDDQAFMRPQCP